MDKAPGPIDLRPALVEVLIEGQRLLEMLPGGNRQLELQVAELMAGHAAAVAEHLAHPHVEVLTPPQRAPPPQRTFIEGEKCPGDAGSFGRYSKKIGGRSAPLYATAIVVTVRCVPP